MAHPATRPRTQLHGGLYRTHHGDVFLPGAGNVVFEPAFGLPPIQLIGPSVQAGALRVIAGPQIMVSQTAKIAGIGGVQAGQLLTQPLNIPDVLSQGGD